MIDAFLMPNSILVEEQPFGSSLDRESNLSVEETPHTSLRPVSLAVELFKAGGLQILNFGLVSSDTSPKREFLVDDFFSVR